MADVQVIRLLEIRARAAGGVQSARLGSRGREGGVQAGGGRSTPTSAGNTLARWAVPTVGCRYPAQLSRLQDLLAGYDLSSDLQCKLCGKKESDMVGPSKRSKFIVHLGYTHRFV